MSSRDLAIGRKQCLAHDCDRAGHWVRIKTPVAILPRWRWRWAGDWCGDHQRALMSGWTRHGLIHPIRTTVHRPSPDWQPPPPPPRGTNP